MNPILLIAGPTGVGKSSVIDSLCSRGLFCYIRPYTTRPLREGERNKISISDEEYEERLHAGEFLVTNSLYGFRYGTPRKELFDAISGGPAPILDWPVLSVQFIKNVIHPARSLAYYLTPPDDATLKVRLVKRDGEFLDDSRWDSVKDEIARFRMGDFNDSIDATIVCAGSLESVVNNVITQLKRDGVLA